MRVFKYATINVMPPSPKQPIGKIALALGIALIALLTIWLVVANPFSGNNDSSDAVPVLKTPKEKALAEEENITDTKNKNNNNKEEFASFESDADPEEFSSSYQSSEPDSNSYQTNEEQYSTTENQTNNTIVIEDQAPPEPPTILGGPSGKTNNRSPQFSFKGEKSARFRCSLNQSGYGKSRDCSYKKKYKNLKRGKKYILRVWQIDIFGQRSYNPAVRKFYLKTKPLPVPSLVRYPKKWTNASTYTFSFKGVRGARFFCSIQSPSLSGASACSSPRSYSDLSDGRYVFRVWQAKNGAVSRVPRKYVFYVDRTAPPAPTIISGPEGETAESSQVFEFSGEQGANFSCAVDSEPASSCTSPKVYNLSPGPYTFQVWQTDRAGNRSLVPAERSFQVSLPSEPTVMSRASRSSLQGFSEDSPSLSYTPTNQQTDEDTTFTVDVLAAIELSDPADDSDAVSPVAGGASNAVADLDMVANLRSNLSWQIGSSVASALSGGSTGSRGLINSLVGTGAIVDSGSRNENNSSQSVTADYNQDVSWGDEAGRYTEVITHTASQTLGN